MYDISKMTNITRLYQIYLMTYDTLRAQSKSKLGIEQDTLKKLKEEIIKLNEELGNLSNKQDEINSIFTKYEKELQRFIQISDDFIELCKDNSIDNFSSLILSLLFSNTNGIMENSPYL